MSTKQIPIWLEDELFQYLSARAERENHTFSEIISKLLLQASRHDCDWRSPCWDCKTQDINDCENCRKTVKWIDGRWKVVES